MVPGRAIFTSLRGPTRRPRRTGSRFRFRKGASLILTHRLNGHFAGLTDVDPQDRPPVKTVFFAFRIMLALGFLMIVLALVGAWLLWRGVLFETRWYLRIVAHCWWIGFVAVIAGWVVTESGRQPWIVYGLKRTAEATSPVAASTVATSLALFVVVYGIVFAMGIYYINRLIVRGVDVSSSDLPGGVSSRPLAAAQDAGREALAGG